MHSEPRNIINFLCLVTKQYIYKQRCLKKELSKTELSTTFRSLKNTELFIAKKNNKEYLHRQKWLTSVGTDCVQHVNEWAIT